MEITFNLSGREEITTKWLLVKKQEKRGDLNSSFGYSVKSIDIFFSLDTSKGILMHHLGEIHLFELLCLEHGSQGSGKERDWAPLLAICPTLLFAAVAHT